MYDFLIGKTLAECQTYLATNGLSWRIASEDGEDYILTADFHPNRINVSLMNNIITEYSMG